MLGNSGVPRVPGAPKGIRKQHARVELSVPDGIDTAPDGRVFVAARALVIYGPDGKLISTQPTPEKPVDIALGEADMNTVFIAAGSSVYRFRLPDDLQNKTGARH